MSTVAQSPGAVTGPQLDNRRIAAALIDLAVPVGFAAVAHLAGLSLTRGVLLVALGWTLYYFFALESGSGQTLGKRAMKLRVVSADGTPASMEQIAKRTVVRILDGHIVGLIVMLATGERRQRLGDIVAGTIVTEAGPESGPAPTPLSERVAQLHSEAPEAAPDAPATPAPSKRSLRMPSLKGAAPKLPSIAKLSLPKPSLRKRAATADPADQAAPDKPAKRSLLKSELKLPSFGKRDKRAVKTEQVTAHPVGSALLKGRRSEAPATDDVPEVKPFAPFTEPSVEPEADAVPYPEPEPVQPAADAPDEVEYGPEARPPISLDDFDPQFAPDPAAAPSVEFDPEFDPDPAFAGEGPSVELDRPQPEPDPDPGPVVELDGPDPVVEVDEPGRPDDYYLADEPRIELEGSDPVVELDEPEPDPVDPPADEEVVVKPIETVSAIDLVMKDAQERHPADD